MSDPCFIRTYTVDKLMHYFLFPLAGKTVKELRQLFFRMKDEVFANPKFGVVFNSEALEKMLKDAIGPTKRMSEIKHPK